jgi:hypothetical protein
METEQDFALGYIIGERISAGLVKVRSVRHGEQVWVQASSCARKSHRCAACGSPVDRRERLFRPLDSNVRNRADRICPACASRAPRFLTTPKAPTRVSEIPYRGWQIQLVDTGRTERTPGGRATIYDAYAQFCEDGLPRFVDSGFKSSVLPQAKTYIREKLREWES